MKKDKNDRLQKDLERFKRNFYNFVYIYRIFNYCIEDFFNANDEFICENKYITKCCLYSLSVVIINKLNTIEKEMLNISKNNIF